MNRDNHTTTRSGNSEYRTDSRPQHRGARNAAGRRARLLLCFTGIAGLTVAGAIYVSGSHTSAAQARTDRLTTAPNSSHSPSTSADAPPVTPRASVTPSATPTIPESGPGTFTIAPGQSAAVGTGEPLRYTVEVEDGIDVSLSDAAQQVERILADPRGWTADGTSAFARISTGQPDFVVEIATPKTVDKICGEYGLDTGGEVNCSVGQHVMVNLKRWILATPAYADDVTSYRALIINHEVGHFLGHGHVTCPGAGQPAPVMMQQIKGLKGCQTNVWPYTADGRYVTGPSVP